MNSSSLYQRDLRNILLNLRNLFITELNLKMVSLNLFTELTLL